MGGDIGLALEGAGQVFADHAAMETLQGFEVQGIQLVCHNTPLREERLVKVKEK